MGHTRLGHIPKSKKWAVVVSSVMGGQSTIRIYGAPHNPDIAKISSDAIDAAEGGLTEAIKDTGLLYTFYLLTQLALSSRQDNWTESLMKVGIQLPDDSSVFDLVAQFQHSVDDYVYENASSTDISEIAQQAAGEVISALSDTQTTSLFEGGEDNLRLTVREISTKNGFSHFGQNFFGCFLTRFLNFYLSRITASQVGQQRLQQIGDVSTFNDELRLHCYQSARIVRDFCGEWYSKTEWQQGINLENTSRFMAVALKKLQQELKQQKVAND